MITIRFDNRGEYIISVLENGIELSRNIWNTEYTVECSKCHFGCYLFRPIKGEYICPECLWESLSKNK